MMIHNTVPWAVYDFETATHEAIDLERRVGALTKALNTAITNCKTFMDTNSPSLVGGRMLPDYREASVLHQALQDLVRIMEGDARKVVNRSWVG
jgi:hypothetical protein